MVNTWTRKTIFKMAFRESRRLLCSLSNNYPKLNQPPIKENAKREINHVFTSMNTWESKNDFLKHLKENIIFNEGGVLGINKPYGIHLKSIAASPANVKLSAKSISTVTTPYGLIDVLPELSASLGVKKLTPLLIAERYTSGVSLFATNEEVEQKIISSIRISNPLKINPYSYWAVTLGNPIPPSGSEKVGLGWLSGEAFEGKLPVLVKEFSKREVEKGSVKSVRVDYVTASFSRHKSSANEALGDVSLIDVRVSSASNHFLRVFLADRLSPVLGDHIFGNRAASVLGTAMRLGPVQAANVASHQKIPKHILEHLGVKHPSQVPTFLHLKEITLPKFYKKSDLVVRASSPGHFEFACKCLDLDLKD